MAGLQRVINIFMDKQVDNSDSVTPLVVLGKTYDNVSKTYDDFVVVSSNKNVNKSNFSNQNLESSNSNTNRQKQDKHGEFLVHNAGAVSFDTPTADSKDIASAVNDLKEKFLTNISSLFNLKNNFTSDKDVMENLLETNGENNNANRSWPEMFLKDVQSRAWLTYRCGFEPIAKDPNSPSNVFSALIRGNFQDIGSEGFSTDAGWGCMIRTSQTLLANTLLTIHLGRDWCFDANINNDIHDTIMSWFMDVHDAPFSIHKFVAKGQMCGKSSGEWFGPSAASISIQSLCNEFENAHVNVFIGEHSGEVYETDLLKCFHKSSNTKKEAIELTDLDSVLRDDEFVSTDNSEDGSRKPVLILLGIRLGIDNVNKIYYPGLKKLLSLPGTVGIAGGRPSSSYYFFGYQADDLFYLDPHVFYKQALTKKNFDLKSLHTTFFHKLNLSDMDPSMLIGLIIKDEKEWHALKKLINDSKELSKIVHIVEGSKSDFDNAINCVIDDFDEESFVCEDDDGVKITETHTSIEGHDFFQDNSNINASENKTDNDVIAI